MDAVALGFRDGVFDVVACIQNGIAAFDVDQTALMREAVRVTRPGGILLFSSYAAAFWPERLDWFHRQAAEGLIGEIDPARTGDGVITCKDGFRATTATPDDFRRLAATLDLNATIQEVDASSLFCEVRVGSDNGTSRERKASDEWHAETLR
jgi:2-polyprenyl-6-hydroxyphenyl methylase/3-demethylubiquinone-9 3-methyltransferase